MVKNHGDILEQPLLEILFRSNAYASELYSLERLSSCLAYNHAGQPFDARRHVMFKTRLISESTEDSGQEQSIPVAVTGLELIDDLNYDVMIDGYIDSYDDIGQICKFWRQDKRRKNSKWAKRFIWLGTENCSIEPNSRVLVFYNTATGMSLIKPIAKTTHPAHLIKKAPF